MERSLAKGGHLTKPCLANGTVSTIELRTVIAIRPKSKPNSHRSKTLRNTGGGWGATRLQPFPCDTKF